MHVQLSARKPFQFQRALLTRYFAPQARRIALLAGLILVDIGLRLVNPQIIRLFIDTAQAGGPLRMLTTAAVLFLLVGLLGRGSHLASAYAGLDLGWAATNQLRADLAAHLLRLDMPFHKQHTPGELIERVDGDVTTLAEFFAELGVRIVGNALLIVGILVFLYRESAAAGLALTVYTALVVIALVFVGRIGVRAWTAARGAWADQMGFLEERFQGTEDIRGVGAEAHALSRLSRLTLNLLYRVRAGWLANALGYVITNFLFIVGYGLGLALGSLLYLRGDVTIGTAFLIVYYIGMLSAPMDEIRGQAEHLQQATAGVQRVGELLALQPTVQDAAARRTPVAQDGILRDTPLRVSFDHVSFRYRDTTDLTGLPDLTGLNPVLHDVTFDLAPGRVLGVLGRTGSGKTTLTRLLFRLYDPEAGAIRIGGTDLRDVPFATLRAAVGLVTQDVQLFGATVAENITLFDETVPKVEIEAALARLGLLDWVRAMPQGLATRLEPGGGGISAGEAQLLAFARILLRDPAVVVLDEAASRLDPVTERRLERAIDALLDGTLRNQVSGRNLVSPLQTSPLQTPPLQTPPLQTPPLPADRLKPPLQPERTAIIIAHRLHTVQRADDILILEAGRVVEFGPRAALAADPDSHFSRLLRTGLEEALA